MHSKTRHQRNEHSTTRSIYLALIFALVVFLVTMMTARVNMTGSSKGITSIEGNKVKN